MIVIRKMRNDRVQSVPSQARIRQLTAEIRQNWTSSERNRRSSFKRWVELLEFSPEPRRKGSFDDY